MEKTLRIERRELAQKETLSSRPLLRLEQFCAFVWLHHGCVFLFFDPLRSRSFECVSN